MEVTVLSYATNRTVFARRTARRPAGKACNFFQSVYMKLIISARGFNNAR
jgi:hypothetical protein